MVLKFEDKLIVIIEQGGIAKAAFTAINKTINRITIIIVFSSCNLNPYKEIAKEQ
jgi:hypothetical protein